MIIARYFALKLFFIPNKNLTEFDIKYIFIEI
jgi:hypothetical protein